MGRVLCRLRLHRWDHNWGSTGQQFRTCQRCRVVSEQAIAVAEE